ncbi:MAG: Rieske (2Fe-2S) protein [Gammaproteobacteria bacterium]|nr:Rieske (2Fe-2S) protein [Gammaproteobacteria bacterium]
MEKLCPLAAIENLQSKGFTLRGTKFFIVRRGSRVFAYHNSCPHMGVPLEWVEDRFLDYDGELIQCSTHGALFTIEQGRCIFGPCSGQSLQPIKLELRDENIWVDLP